MTWLQIARSIALGLTILLVGCSNVPMFSEDNTYSDNYSGIERGTVFITPFKAPSGFDEGKKKILQEIATQLTESGWKVTTMSNENFLEIWSEIISSVGGMYSPADGSVMWDKYEHAMGELVKTVTQSGDFKAVIVPSLLLKRAVLKNRHAQWDGVKRKAITKLPNANDLAWSGTTTGLSLELVVFDAGGNWLLTSFGGLELPYYSKMKGGRPVNEMREDIFDSKSNISSGVQAALLPLVDRARIASKGPKPELSQNN